MHGDQSPGSESKIVTSDTRRLFVSATLIIGFIVFIVAIAIYYSYQLTLDKHRQTLLEIIDDKKQSTIKFCKQ